MNGVKIVEGYGYPWKTSDYVDCSNGGGEPPDEDEVDNLIYLLLCDAVAGWK